MLVDTHAHLDFPEFADDFDAILSPSQRGWRRANYYNWHNIEVESQGDQNLPKIIPKYTPSSAFTRTP